MNEFMMALMQKDAQAISTQSHLNHQSTMHLMDLAFTELATKMDIAESYAAQGLSHAAASRDAMGLRTSIHVPAKDA